jgi:PKD repeat protein
LVLAVAILAALAAPAHAYLYWQTVDGDASGNAFDSIGRVGLDGSDYRPHFIQGAMAPASGFTEADLAYGVAVGAGHVFWAGTIPSDLVIKRAGLSGTGIEPSFIGGLAGPALGLATDGGRLYWGEGSAIATAGVDGSGINHDLIDTSAPADVVSAGGGHVYWSISDFTGENDVWQASPDGSGARKVFTYSCGSCVISGLALDGSHLFVSVTLVNGTTVVTQLFDTAASKPKLIATVQSAVEWLTAAGGRLYWSDAFRPYFGTVGEDGSGFNDMLAPSPLPVAGLAADTGGAAPPRLPSLQHVVNAHAEAVSPTTASVVVVCPLPTCHTTITSSGGRSAITSKLLKLHRGIDTVRVGLNTRGRRSESKLHHVRLRLTVRIKGIPKPAITLPVTLAPASKLTDACPASVKAGGQVQIGGVLAAQAPPAGAAHDASLRALPGRSVRALAISPSGRLLTFGGHTGPRGAFKLDAALPESGKWRLLVGFAGDSGHEASIAHVCAIHAAPVPPVASFTAPATAQIGQNILFDGFGSSSHDPRDPLVSAVFDFGDGSPAKTIGFPQADNPYEVSANHAYQAGGVYTVKLTVTNQAGLSATATHTVIVPAAPVASFTYSPSSPTSGSAVTFDASASSDPDDAIVSYNWNFGDGSIGASGVNVSHTFEIPGTYTVGLVLKDQSGLFTSVTKTVTVAGPLSDLEVASIDSAVLGAGPTQPCTITYTLKNIGTLGSPPSNTQVTLSDSHFSYTPVIVQSPGIAAGGSDQEQAVFAASGRTGCGTTGSSVTVTANYAHMVVESDYSNDTLTKTF